MLANNIIKVALLQPSSFTCLVKHLTIVPVLTDGPSSTIGSCILSALSIPPSQKANNSIGLESIHNYANVLNPVTFVNADQYSVVAIYTETEASEVDQDLSDSAEVQIQTDFYEEEIVAVSVAGPGATSLRAEESCETVDVAKALDTLTKAFALKKESISHEGLTEKSKDELRSENSPDKEQTLDGDETSDRRENINEEAMEDSQAGDVEINSCTRLKDNPDSLSVHEEMTVYTHEDHAFETQQTLSSDSVSQPTYLRSESSPSLQEPCEIRRSPSVISEGPIMYINIYFNVQKLFFQSQEKFCINIASTF